LTQIIFTILIEFPEDGIRIRVQELIDGGTIPRTRRCDFCTTGFTRYFHRSAECHFALRKGSALKLPFH
jgi:hypothetical protein